MVKQTSYYSRLLDPQFRVEYYFLIFAEIF